MSIEQALKDKCKEDFKYVDDIEELICDNLLEVNEITESDKHFLERFKNLTRLSLNHIGLKNIKNFPILPSLTHVFS